MPQLCAQDNPARSSRTWQWVSVVILSAVAGALVSQVLLVPSPAQAQAANGAGGKEGIFALAGQLSKDNYGVFLVDPEGKTMAIYEWAPDRIIGRKLRLIAARNFAFDLQLDDYNNADPLPRDVKALVQQHRKLESGPASQP